MHSLKFWRDEVCLMSWLMARGGTGELRLGGIGDPQFISRALAKYTPPQGQRTVPPAPGHAVMVAPSYRFEVRITARDCIYNQCFRIIRQHAHFPLKHRVLGLTDPRIGQIGVRQVHCASGRLTNAPGRRPTAGYPYPRPL